MILILSDRFDKHADKVTSELDDNAAPYYRMNLDVESLKKTRVHFNGDYWIIDNGDKQIESTKISCVWLRRPFVELTLEEQNDYSNDFKMWRSEWNKTMMGLFLDLNGLPWLNPIRKAYKAENKYLQMKYAKEIGFTLPEIIVSNYKEELIEFSKRYEKVVLKLMSQEFYQMEDGTFKGIYVNQVTSSELESFNDYSENPIVLQQYIEKAYEVRYTVVGTEHLACKIESQKSTKTAIDWRRYDIPNTPHYKIDPPEDIKLKVTKFMDKLDLQYGALDFIVTQNNDWYFLEINCLGQWLWIEDLTNLPISKAIATWLISAGKGGDNA